MPVLEKGWYLFRKFLIIVWFSKSSEFREGKFFERFEELNLKNVNLEYRFFEK